MAYRIDVLVSEQLVFAPATPEGRLYRVLSPEGETKYAVPIQWQENGTVATKWANLRWIGPGLNEKVLERVARHWNLFRRFFIEVPGAPMPGAIQDLFADWRIHHTADFLGKTEDETAVYPGSNPDSPDYLGLILHVDDSGKLECYPQGYLIYRLKDKWLALSIYPFDLRDIPDGLLPQRLAISDAQFHSLARNV